MGHVLRFQLMGHHVLGAGLERRKGEDVWVRAGLCVAQYPKCSGNGEMKIREKNKKTVKVQGDLSSLQQPSAQTLPSQRWALCFRGCGSFLSQEAFALPVLPALFQMLLIRNYSTECLAIQMEASLLSQTCAASERTQSPSLGCQHPREIFSSFLIKQ